MERASLEMWIDGPGSLPNEALNLSPRFARRRLTPER
jgi:hypothetical protein